MKHSRFFFESIRLSAIVAVFLVGMVSIIATGGSDSGSSKRDSVPSQPQETGYLNPHKWKHRHVEVPPGTKELKVEVTGVVGLIVLIVSKHSPPDMDMVRDYTYDCLEEAEPLQDAVCVFPSPEVGTWYIGLTTTSGSDFILTISMDDGEYDHECGWDPDYSNLQKVEVDWGYYHVNESGIRHGPYVSFHDIEQTQVNWAYCYYEGEYHGRYVNFWENGYQGLDGYYDMGLRHGKWTSWHENGRKSREISYINDIAHGLYISWDEDGNKLREGNYNLGDQVDTWFVRLADGSIHYIDYSSEEDEE